MEQQQDFKDELVQEIYELSDEITLKGMEDLEDCVGLSFSIELYSNNGKSTCNINGRRYVKRYTRLYDVSDNMLIFDVISFEGEKIVPIIYKHDSRGLCLLLNMEDTNSELNIARLRNITHHSAVKQLSIDFDVITKTTYEMNYSIN